jgi:hypothetical protein
VAVVRYGAGVEHFPMDVPDELAPYADILAGALLPSVVLDPVPVTGPLPVLSTKLGGAPDLPPGADWPLGATGEPLPFMAQVNLTDLAGRFPDVLPWPTGGGLLQLFSIGDVRDATVLVHRDLAALRPATPAAEPLDEVRLDPTVKGCLSNDRPADLDPLLALADRLGREQPTLGKLLDDWRNGFTRPYFGAKQQVGGGGLWIQDRSYWEAWALDWEQVHGRDPFESPDDSVDVYARASGQAYADGWQVVLNLIDDFGGFFFLAPPDADGRWDLDRLQLLYQSE